MTTGLHTVNLANKMLDPLRNTAFSAIATVAMKLHTGDPGASAATAPSAETTRKAITFSAPSGGAIAMSGSLQWASWSAGSETLSHFSVWDSTTAGNPLYTGAFTTAKAIVNGDNANVTTHSVTLTPLMA